VAASTQTYHTNQQQTHEISCRKIDVFVDITVSIIYYVTMLLEQFFVLVFAVINKNKSWRELIGG